MYKGKRLIPYMKTKKAAYLYGNVSAVSSMDLMSYKVKGYHLEPDFWKCHIKLILAV